MLKEDSKTVKNINTPRKKRDSFVLTDEEILTLARWACTIEDHYDKPMDMEWAKDGETGDLFIVQARPETVQSQKKEDALKQYSLKEQGAELAVAWRSVMPSPVGKGQYFARPEGDGAF